MPALIAALMPVPMPGISEMTPWTILASLSIMVFSALEVALLELVGHVIDLHERVELVQEAAHFGDLRDEAQRRVEHARDDHGAVEKGVARLLRHLHAGLRRPGQRRE